MLTLNVEDGVSVPTERHRQSGLNKLDPTVRKDIVLIKNNVKNPCTVQFYLNKLLEITGVQRQSARSSLGGR